MRIRNGGGNWTRWSPYERSRTWRLSAGAGNKTLYVQYKDLVGNASSEASDGIGYRP